MDPDLTDAVAAVQSGALVVYPTETVYGLGADALDPAAVERVYAAKSRPRDEPLSMALPTVAAARPYVRAADRTREFMAEFLPGPVTVIAPKTDDVPDALTAGRDRVGIRVPDHEVANALLEAVSPITATSANRSGSPSARQLDELDPEIRDVAVLVDGGRTPGGSSTVVDPERDVIHRRGRQAEAVERWLAAN